MLIDFSRGTLATLNLFFVLFEVSDNIFGQSQGVTRVGKVLRNVPFFSCSLAPKPPATNQFLQRNDLLLSHHIGETKYESIIAAITAGLYQLAEERQRGCLRV